MYDTGILEANDFEFVRIFNDVIPHPVLNDQFLLAKSILDFMSTLGKS